MARLLPDWISAYIKYVKNTEPRESYKEWVAVSTVASVLQRKAYIEWGSEIWFPNFYIILTGPPAARKGTAMRPARELLDKLGIYIAADETSRQKLILRIVEQVSSVDTDEKVGYMHCSLTINASELTVFLNKADEQMIPSLCDWFDCRNRWLYETVSRGSQYITNIWVNLLGATTPRNLQTALPPEAFGSGLISRTLFIYEDDKDKIIIFPSYDKALEEPLLHDLEEISMLAGRFTVEKGTKDKNFIKSLTLWRHDVEERSTITDNRFEDYVQRKATHLFKLCMVLSASRSDTRIINLADFERAADMLKSIEKNMGYAFQGIGQYSLAGVQARIMRILAQEKQISRQELITRFHMEVNSVQLSEIIGTLMEMHYCQLDHVNDILTYIQEKDRR